MNTLNWLITSSEDPEKISLFVKSVCALAVLFGLDATVVQNVGSQLASFIAGAGMAISAATAVYGLIRKARNGQWSAA